MSQFSALFLSLLTATSAVGQSDSGLRARLDSYLAAVTEMGIFSGVALVARGGEVQFERGYGLADREAGTPNTKDTSFKIMSVTKSLTAVLAMRLAQDGVFTLEDRVGDHLPGWPGAWGDVRVSHLLEHSAGLPVDERIWFVGHRSGNRGLELWREVAQSIPNSALRDVPGTRHRYDNLNYELVGAVLESVTGEKYPELLQSKVLELCGAESSGVDDGSRRKGLAVGYIRRNGAPVLSSQDMSSIRAAGGVYASARDLHRVHLGLEDERLLSAASQRRMTTPRLGSYALGWSTRPVHGHACCSHSGGANGYVAIWMRFPKEGACVVVLSNFAFAPISRIGADLAVLLFEKPCAMPKLVEPAELEGYEGVYESPASPWHVLVRRSGRVLLAFDVFSGRDRVAGRTLIPVGKARFAAAFGRRMLRFTNGTLFISAQGSETGWRRLPSARETWRKRVGVYRSDSRQIPELSLREREGVLRLDLGPGWKQDYELVPVTDGAAIVLFDDAGGTMLRALPDGLVWRRPGGELVRMWRR